MLLRPSGQTETWTRVHELLATVLEVVSVQAAERRLKKPVEVPRPRAPKRRAEAAPEKRRATEQAAGAVSVTDAMGAMREAGRVRGPAVPSQQPPGSGPAVSTDVSTNGGAA